jgi:hypothetical protein
MLRANLGDRNDVTIREVAVGQPGRRDLYLGKNNLGEASFYDLGEQRLDAWVTVDAMDPKNLPYAEILKIDAEGAETEILEMMDGFDYDLILLEFHDEDDRRKIDALLKDYSLIGGNISRVDRGTLKYVHKRLIPQ